MPLGFGLPELIIVLVLLLVIVLIARAILR